MAGKKAIYEGEEFLVDDDVTLGEIIPEDAASVLDQKTGREMTRAEFSRMPAAGSNVRSNFVKLEKGDC